MGRTRVEKVKMLLRHLLVILDTLSDDEMSALNDEVEHLTDAQLERLQPKDSRKIRFDIDLEEYVVK